MSHYDRSHMHDVKYDYGNTMKSEGFTTVSSLLDMCDNMTDVIMDRLADLRTTLEHGLKPCAPMPDKPDKSGESQPGNAPLVDRVSSLNVTLQQINMEIEHIKGCVRL